jgi:hypothetical protein
LTIEEFQTLIRLTVHDVLSEIFENDYDPDKDLELSAETVERLERYLSTPLENQRLYSLEEIEKELGLND